MIKIIACSVIHKGQRIEQVDPREALLEKDLEAPPGIATIRISMMMRNMYNDYSPMKWEAGYAMGDSNLNSQHKELMDFYNDALDHCCGVETVEREYFDKTIDGFIKLLEDHQKTEENFLSNQRYPLFEEHKIEHVKLLEKISLVKQEAQSDRWHMHLYILTITWKDWFMRHFNEYDRGAEELFGLEKSDLPTAEVELSFKR